MAWRWWGIPVACSRWGETFHCGDSATQGHHVRGELQAQVVATSVAWGTHSPAGGASAHDTRTPRRGASEAGRSWDGEWRRGKYLLHVQMAAWAAHYRGAVATVVVWCLVKTLRRELGARVHWALVWGGNDRMGQVSKAPGCTVQLGWARYLLSFNPKIFQIFKWFNMWNTKLVLLEL
jgi:hypothetical protein